MKERPPYYPLLHIDSWTDPFYFKPGDVEDDKADKVEVEEVEEDKHLRNGYY